MLIRNGRIRTLVGILHKNLCCCGDIGGSSVYAARCGDVGAKFGIGADIRHNQVVSAKTATKMSPKKRTIAPMQTRAGFALEHDNTALLST